MPHGNLTTVSTSATETAVLRKERSDATIGDPRSGRSLTMQSKSSLEPPDRAAAGGPGQIHGETRRSRLRSDVVGGRAQAATARKRAVAAAIAERGLRRAAGAGLAPRPRTPPERARDAGVPMQGSRQEARLDIDRWVGEGGLVPFGPAAVVRSSTTTRR
jgi:hypothetical protein